jgi:fatty acid amide hydrolase
MPAAASNKLLHTSSPAINLSAVEIAGLIKSGAISARETIEAHIRRIEEVNPSINAVVVPLFDEARRAAERADDARRHGEKLGALHGVPVTIKESFDVAGTPTTLGLTTRTGHRAKRDGFLVARLREAGAIVLGKTNVPQLLMRVESDNPIYGRTNNPHDLGRAPGGSSGGCAAIIAAGGSALSMGSDIGGSIRNPAHACGIQGFKPTSGRLTMMGHGEIFAGLETILAQPGPLARTIDDLILAMKILAAPGGEVVDPSIAPVPLLDPAQVQLKDLRIGFYTDNGFITPAPALRRAVHESADALRASGAHVEEWVPPRMADAWRIYLGLAFADGMRSARRALRGSKQDLQTRAVLLSAGTPKSLLKIFAKLYDLFGQKSVARAARSLGALSADAYWQLTAERAKYRAEFIEAMNRKKFDAIICPPDVFPALPHGSSFYLTDALSYTGLYNLLGMPAGVVAATRVRAGEETDRSPNSWDLTERTARTVEMNSEGLPVGVQIVARHWREDIALAAMSALEKQFKNSKE